MGNSRPLFVYLRSFQSTYGIKTEDFSGIRTRIDGVEREYASYHTLTSTLFLKKMGHPRPLLFIFGLFQTNISTILQQIHVKKCPSSIRHWNSYPRP